ncbi:MAG: hypothetical protein J6W00_00520 [Lentisphaeria bacterium]|nr:hypothetical protein [Lentisphaeria bacterium]
MKLYLMITASVCMLVLTGCMSVSEPESPALTEKFSADIQLHLEGFQLYSVREKQHRVGNSYFTAYNFKTDSWLLGDGSYSETTYERMLDDKFPGIVKDIFESAGANIRGNTPRLKIEGRIGDGRFMWSSPAMWYRDAPVFIVSVCTFGMVITRERENDVRLIVYNTKGKRLKEYHATETYYTYGFGLPISGMINDKVRSWYCDRMAAKFALIKCVNEFIRDWNKGLFK